MSVTISQRTRRVVALAAGNKDLAETFCNGLESGSEVVNTDSKVLTIDLPDLDAGVDLTDFPLARFDVPIVLEAIRIIPDGDYAGIDAGNTMVVTVKQTSHAIVTATFDDSNVPTSLSTSVDGDEYLGNDLGTVDATWKSVSANVLLTVTVTNGATADPPPLRIQLLFHQ